MAEARREEEEELKDVSVLCNRNQATDRSERNKPDQIQPSSRPLASIRAAFKRTSGRTTSQSDHTRDRRRPEITIVSAEPLASSSWFPGASALPSPQPVWGASIPVAAKPPPSYDQVIKEKTQEQDVTPTPPPRRSHTTTIATQTDTLGTANSPDPECRTPSQSSCEAPKLKRPPKPPRPTFPVKPKPAPRESPLQTAAPAFNQREAKSTHTEENHCANAPLTNAIDPNTTDDPNRSPAASTASALDSEPSEPCGISDNTVPVVSNPDPSSPSESPRTQAPRPVPRPRTRPSKPVRTEVKVQTLVRIKDSGDAPQVISGSRDPSPNPYLKELLEVFSADAGADLSDSEGSHRELSDESGDDSSDMSIRNKIQAFEGQASTNDHVSTPVPVPRPRNQPSKPPVVAPKPALVPRPSVKRQIDENHNDSGNEVARVASKLVPTPAPRPVPPKKPSIDQREDPTVATPKTALLPPPRPPLQNKPNSFPPQEETAMPKAPPPVLRKPSRELLNHNNHNSTSLPAAPSSPTEWPNPRSSRLYSAQSRPEDECAESPVPGPTPPKPVRGVEGSFNRGGVSRKPTMIRVPSTSAKLADDSQDAPPPLPVQKPVGGPPPPSQRHSFRSQDTGSGSSPDPSLPPRPASVKVLPPRPPPAKAGPDRPPPPRKEASQPPTSVSSVAKGASPNLGQYQERRSSKTPKRGPVLPPRPKPGHLLYNKYTLEIPHAIAEFDCNGTNPGELSFQKNEVLVLLDQIDSKTFECQAGAASGRVQKSYMKIITPLSAYSHQEPPQNTQPDPSGNGGMQVQALYDFIPEGPGELHLRAGDVVNQVEQLDDEWYLGTLRGATGFFPISHVKLMSAVPSTHAKTLPEAPSNGPRCVARFSFEAEHSDELMFSEGDVIQLQEYIGQDWVRGKLGTCVGIFPLNYVEIIEDLPAPTASDAGQTKIALPGMVSSPSMPSKPDQAEWAEALYDFTAETDDDLPFQQGDRILVTAHLDEEWCSGRVNGREGVFPKAFVQFS